MMHSLPEGYRALVMGASGAIGSALLLQLLNEMKDEFTLILAGQTPRT